MFCIRVKAPAKKAHGWGRHVWFWLFLWAGAINSLFHGAYSLLALLPGYAGQLSRGMADMAHGMLLGIMTLPPEEYVHVHVEEACKKDKNGKRKRGAKVYVSIRSMGFPGRASFPGCKASTLTPPPLWLAPFARFIACVLALYIIGLLLPGSVTGYGALWSGLLLAVFYILIRPLSMAVALPFSLLLFNLPLLLLDGLLVQWAGAWAGGIALRYWPSVGVAALIALFHSPYTLYRERVILSAARL